MKNIILLVLVIIFIVVIIQFIINKKVIIEGNDDPKITNLKSILHLKKDNAYSDTEIMTRIKRIHPFNASYTEINAILDNNTYDDTNKVNQLLNHFGIDIFPYRLTNISRSDNQNQNILKNISRSDNQNQNQKEGYQNQKEGLINSNSSAHIEIQNNNTKYYIFTQGTYTFTGIIGKVEYLLIGGGGAGGSSHGGGGGAGGVIRGLVDLVAVNYTVTVGEGGILNANRSYNGSNSIFSGEEGLINIIAYGGGYGGGDNNGDAYSIEKPNSSIGSGGGGCGYHFNGGPGLTKSGQGNDGSSARTSPGGGGGGGGAGGPGFSDSKDNLNYLGKAGGDGTNAHSDILSVISTSTQMTSNWKNATNHDGKYYIAAGGGGGSWGYNGGAAYSYGAPGGKGGGGNGGMFNGFTVLPTYPIQNTGSGGGGGGSGNQPGTPGASGLVVIMVHNR